MRFSELRVSLFPPVSPVSLESGIIDCCSGVHECCGLGPRRILKRFVQQGRSERRGEAYSFPYVEPLSEARTMLAELFSILLLDRG